VADPAPPIRTSRRWPLPLRVLIGVCVGGAIGGWFGQREIVLGWTTGELAALGALYIRVLTLLATPLIFFAVVEAFVRTPITGRQGVKLLAVCALNIAAAFAVGLTILNVWQPGLSWQSVLAANAANEPRANAAGEPAPAEPAGGGMPSLRLVDLLDSYIPKSFGPPILTVAAAAILVGAAMRSLRAAPDAELAAALGTFERLIVACYQITVRILAWLIELAPWAIAMVIAGLVGGTDDVPRLLERVGVYLATILAALGVHALGWYPLSAWLLGGVPPRVYFGEGAAAILTGFSVNSSLATAPLTLKALDRMGVSESSARLSACVGTNFNNDGITLYEAITALFVAQAAGLELSLAHQASILLVVLAASMGIAGIPNSGLIILTLVLKAAQLPEAAVALALPMVYSIDFINARVRSAVNVMGDLQVAILLDAGRGGRAAQSGDDAA
jgi:DAACS family dicarboxylate/amino acid:cation (Na+ or H+) symporter